jgi:putative zinc finger/helix-turn-helix YgiT family protein
MSHNRAEKTKRPFGAERPFPWRCRHCGKTEVSMGCVRYDAEIRHDGRLYRFTIPQLRLPVCRACGEKVFTDKVDDQISDALRVHLHLLTPEEMRAGIERLSLTQKEAAEWLGIAEATLSRWLTNTQIQSRALDNLLRVFFAVPEARALLRGPGHDPSLGAENLGGPGSESAIAPGLTG